MSRIPQIAEAEATPQQAELLAEVKAKLGQVPNMLRALANSPAALRAYLGFSGALGAGEGLDAQQREVVALTVAEANGCEYCLAAHATLGKMAGLTPEAVEASRRADGLDDKSRAVARFANAVLASRGRVAAHDYEAFVAAGFDAAAVTEVVAHVALNVYTNYFNNLVGVDVDFPAAPPLHPAEAEESTCATACGCSA